MIKKYYIATLLTLAGYFSTVAQYDPEALTILDAMSAKYKKIEAFKVKFTQKLTNESAALDETIEGDISVKGNMFYLEVAGQKIYNDGENIYTLNEEIAEVTISQYIEEESEITLSNVYDLYKDGFKYALMATLPRGDNVIELDPEDRDKTYFKIRMVIDATNSLKSFTVFEKTGNKYLYDIGSFEETSLDDSYFKFDSKKYPDVEVIDFR